MAAPGHADPAAAAAAAAAAAGDDDAAAPEERQCVASLIENRQREVGLAIFDPARMHLHLLQASSRSSSSPKAPAFAAAPA
jgi:hypothetical protein